jgi:hypothetical protein
MVSIAATTLLISRPLSSVLVISTNAAAPTIHLQHEKAPTSFHLTAPSLTPHHCPTSTCYQCQSPYLPTHTSMPILPNQPATHSLPTSTQKCAAAVTM